MDAGAKASEQSTHTHFMLSINFITKCSIFLAHFQLSTIHQSLCMHIVSSRNRSSPCVCVISRMILRWNVSENYKKKKPHFEAQKLIEYIAEPKFHWIKYAKNIMLKYPITIDYYLFFITITTEIVCIWAYEKPQYIISCLLLTAHYCWW